VLSDRRDANRALIMAERITHQEYVEGIRSRIAQVARLMLENRLSFIEGARAICDLQREADVPHDDADCDGASRGRGAQALVGERAS